MGMRKQERSQVLLLWAGALSSVGTFDCQAKRVGVVTYITLRLMELGDCLSSVKNVAEKAQSRLDEILTEAT
jgi:hypothetical protein